MKPTRDFRLRSRWAYKGSLQKDNIEDISLRTCSSLRKPGNGCEHDNDTAFWLDSKEMYNVYGELWGCSLAKDSPLGSR